MIFKRKSVLGEDYVYGRCFKCNFVLGHKVNGFVPDNFPFVVFINKKKNKKIVFCNDCFKDCQWFFNGNPYWKRIF